MLRVRAYLGAFLVFLFLGFLPATAQDETPETTGYIAIYHINIGQGDATLIIGPTGKTLLMDAGNQGKGAKFVVPLLKALGIDTLDYAVTSHYDADHIGGIDEVFFILTETPVNILDRGDIGPKAPPDTEKYRDYSAFVVENRKPVMLGNTVIDLGPGVNTLIVAANACALEMPEPGDPSPKPIFPLDDKPDENGSSVALVISFGDFDYFVGGDLTGGGKSGNKFTPDIETPVSGMVGDVDILRLNHHGSQTSNNEVFLRTLNPDVAIISVGNGGSNKSRYHHPTRVVLDRLQELHSDQDLRRIFMTNRGETTGGLTEDDLEMMTIADGHVVVFATKTNYSINGQAFRTDGMKSKAFSIEPNLQQECTVNASQNP